MAASVGDGAVRVGAAVEGGIAVDARPDGDPPPRPPAPRLTLGRLKGKQLSTGSLPVAIHFNPAAEDDDDDNDNDNFATAATTAAAAAEGGLYLGRVQHSVRAEDVSRDALRLDDVLNGGHTLAMEGRAVDGSGLAGSRSAPSSEVTTPVVGVRTAPPSKSRWISPKGEDGGSRGWSDQRSFISGIKERFQDPINAFIEKIEESGIKETIDRKLRKTDFVDQKAPPPVPPATTSASAAKEYTGAEVKRFSDPDVRSEAVELVGDRQRWGSGTRSPTRRLAARDLPASPDGPGYQDPLGPGYHGPLGPQRTSSVGGLEELTGQTDGALASAYTTDPPSKSPGLSAGAGPAGAGSGFSVPKSSSYDSISSKHSRGSHGLTDHPPRIASTIKRLITKSKHKASSTVGGSGGRTSPPAYGAAASISTSNGSDNNGYEARDSSAMSMSGLLATGQDLDHEDFFFKKDDSSEFYDPRDTDSRSDSPTLVGRALNPTPTPLRPQVLHHRRSSSLPYTAPAAMEVPTPTPDAPAQVPGGRQSLRTLILPSKQRCASMTAAVLAYILLPMPSFLSGLILGAALAAVAMTTYAWVTAPPRAPRPFVLPELQTLPPLTVPEMRESRNDEGKVKGWMNECFHYKLAEYHISQTHSVLLHLEGTMLRLQTPKQNIAKRAMWDDPTPSNVTFVHQRHYDLRGCHVLLLPEALVKKRLWSKKYPICVVLPAHACKKLGSGESPSRTPDYEDDDVIPSNSAGNDGGGTISGDVSNGELHNEAPTGTRLYLFGRTCREKEDWFRRLQAAAAGRPLPLQISKLLPPASRHGSPSPSPTHRRVGSSSSIEILRHKREGSTDSNLSDLGGRGVAREEGGTGNRESLAWGPGDQSHEERLTDYLRYMARVIPSESLQRLQTPSTPGSPCRPNAGLPNPVLCEPQVAWVNALIFRSFLDFLREEYWVDKIRNKIQNKLNKIHVPYFIDQLTVAGIELGSEVPVIRRASKPYIDDRGLWMDLDIVYAGGFRMRLETKCNLMKLKKTPEPDVPSKHKRSAVTHSDEEDSAESSTDEEGEDNSTMVMDNRPSSQAGGKSHKLLRFVDKIAQSKYFQQATEYKYIKRAMEGVSNTPLVLAVELSRLLGTMTVNIPPPPTDRIWYGFRANPSLWLTAKPWVGEREVNFTHVTDWIEKKLAIEFQRVFVMPNMDDIPIPLMCDHLFENKSS